MEPEIEATCVKTEPQELYIDPDYEIVTVKEEVCEDTSPGTSDTSAWLEYERHKVKPEVGLTEPGVYMKEHLCVDSTSQAITRASPYASEIKREPETVYIRNEFFKEDHTACVTEVHLKEEPYEKAGLCGSDAAVSSNLYVKHEVKEELVLSSESIHRPHATSTLTDTPIKVERHSSTEPESLLVNANKAPQPGDTDRYETPSNNYQCREGVYYNASKQHKHNHSISEGTRGSSANVTTSKRKPRKVEHSLNYMCPDCDYTTVDKRSLKAHSKSHTEKKLYYCDHCSYTSHDKMNLKRHLIRHDRKRRFKCSYCELSFYRKPDVRKHEKTHSTEKPHKCSSCDYQCIRKRELHIHMRTHTGEKPFQCNQCDYKSTRKFSLQRHQLVHGSEAIKFKCNKCSFKTVHKPNLRVHERIHTGEMPYECSHCDFKCRNRCTLRYHLKKSFNCSRQQV